MHLRRMKHVVLAILGLSLLGCEALDDPSKLPPGSPDVEDTRSTALRRIQFEDLPVPAQMSLVTSGNRSFSYAGGGVRVGRFHYVGSLDPDLVTSFYQDNMVLRAFGWKLVSSDKRSNENVLKFAKSEQECTIRVGRENGYTFAHVDVNGAS